MIAAAFVLASAILAEARPAPLPVQFDGNPPCVLDRCLNDDAKPKPPVPEATPPETPPPPIVFPRAIAPGSFDFYVLSLSWSPGFCQTGGAARAGRQCAPGADLRFVVHGLWPQNQHGFPADCDGSATPSRLALDSVRGLYPDEGLARHEWRKHGTCTGLSPTDYFASVRQARGAVTIPPQLQTSTGPQTWAPLDLARAFVAANPRLRTDSMAVTCRQGVLEEVRICFAKDLRGFVACPEVARASCRRPVTVPPPQ